MENATGFKTAPFVFAGLVLIGLGVVQFMRGLPHADGVRVTGRLAEVQVVQYKGTRYRLVYEFQDEAGVTHRFTDPEEKNFEPIVGERIEVSYLPADPDSARRVTDVLSETVLLVWLGGGALVVISVLVPLSGRRGRPDAESAETYP